MHKHFYFFASNTHCALVVAVLEKNKYHSVMDIENQELMDECFLKHSRMGTARMK